MHKNPIIAGNKRSLSTTTLSETNQRLIWTDLKKKIR